MSWSVTLSRERYEGQGSLKQGPRLKITANDVHQLLRHTRGFAVARRDALQSAMVMLELCPTITDVLGEIVAAFLMPPWHRSVQQLTRKKRKRPDADRGDADRDAYVHSGQSMISEICMWTQCEIELLCAMRSFPEVCGEEHVLGSVVGLAGVKYLLYMNRVAHEKWNSEQCGFIASWLWIVKQYSSILDRHVQHQAWVDFLYQFFYGAATNPTFFIRCTL